MKKFFAIIALATLTLVACEKVQDYFEKSDDVTTITAIVGSPKTKTTVDGFDVKWSANDKVAVAAEDNTIGEFDLTGGAGNASGTFNGTLGGKPLGTYAVYPYQNADVDNANNTVTVEYLDSWVYGKTEVPLWGQNLGGNSYQFKNVGGAVLVTYSNVPATANNKKLVFTSNKNITGPVTISNLDSSPSVSTGSMTGNTVTVTGIPGDATSVSVIVPVPAGTGYNITAQLKDATTDAVVPGTLKAATGRTFQLNKITKFDDVDLTPVITVTESPTSTFSKSAQTGTITYNIKRAGVLTSEVVSASSDDDWITISNCTATTVTFSLTAYTVNGNKTREGTINLRFDNAEPKTVTIKQHNK